MMRASLAMLVAAYLLAGCVSDPITHADKMAEPAGLQRDQVQAGSFVLTSYYRITRTDRPLTVYIEGDGLAWRNRYQPSDDPTPQRALGLSLAAVDPTPNVLYLARPCQFTPMASNPHCAATYWTDRRYAEEVVASMNIAVTHYLQRLPGQRVTLVGYSGGGALAVLIAARRSDVLNLFTLAGNLDHVAVNRLHQVSPMPGSLNAIDVAPRVAAIPQLHISGANDRVVPPSVARSFAAAVGSCAQLRILEGVAHESDWAARWPALRLTTLTCS